MGLVACTCTLNQMIRDLSERNTCQSQGLGDRDGTLRARECSLVTMGLMASFSGFPGGGMYPPEWNPRAQSEFQVTLQYLFLLKLNL